MWSRASSWHPSLRRTLLGVVLTAIAIASLLHGAAAYRGALRTADAIFDQHLQELALAARDGAPAAASLAFGFSLQVWGPGGIEFSRSWGAQVPTQPVIGFSDAQVDGRRYRVYVLRSGERLVQVAQDLDARLERARALALRAALPTALLAPLLMLALWLVIERSLAPVERTRREVAARAPGDLSPVSEEGLPAEVLPLVQEMNHLFERARASLHAQQRFIADAAHELRSPLAALKLQAQALREPRAEEDRIAAVRRLDAGIERTIKLASQLLELLRLEGPQPAGEDVDLEAVAREAVSNVLPLAHPKRIDIGFSAAGGARVRGDPAALQSLLRNLLENSIKYSPAGADVEIVIAREGDTLELAVEDSGPGIAPEQRSQAFERFRRLAPGSDPEGTGLGLAIVRAIAERHAATVELTDSRRLGGLRVVVRFPLSEA